MRLSIRTLPALLLLLLSPLAARAETIVINGGTAGHGNPVLAAFPGWGFDFAGQGLAARGTGEKLGNSSTLGCVFCAPGETFGATFVVSTFSGSELSGNALTVGGTTHNFVWYQGSRFEFALAPVVLPSAVTSGSFTVSTPFTFSGTLAGVEPPFGSPPFTFSYDLVGQGVATLNFSLQMLNGEWRWVLGGARYDFQPAEVPEPATLALLGAGLAGLAARRRVRRRAPAARPSAS